MDFVYDNTALFDPKVDAEPLPADAVVNQYVSASDMNLIRDALQDLRAAVLRGVKAVETIADLTTFPAAFLGEVVYVKGYYAAYDGGGGYFRAEETGNGGTWDIKDITKPATITTHAAHGLTDGAVVQIAGATGMTGVNGTWVIAHATATTFALVGATMSGTYTGGGRLGDGGTRIPTNTAAPKQPGYWTYWQRIIEDQGQYNAKWWGAKGDATQEDAHTYLQAALNYSFNNMSTPFKKGGILYIPPGLYLIKDQLNWYQSIGATLTGGGCGLGNDTNTTTIHWHGADSTNEPTKALLKMTKTWHCEVNNITFDCVAYEKHISGVSNDNPIQITVVGHGLYTGQQITIADVQGITIVNDTWAITRIDDNTFSIPVNGANAGTYVPGTGYFNGGNRCAFGIYLTSDGTTAPGDAITSYNTFNRLEILNAAVCGFQMGNKDANIDVATDFNTLQNCTFLYNATGVRITQWNTNWFTCRSCSFGTPWENMALDDTQLLRQSTGYGCYIHFYPRSIVFDHCGWLGGSTKGCIYVTRFVEGPIYVRNTVMELAPETGPFLTVEDFSGGVYFHGMIQLDGCRYTYTPPPQGLSYTRSGSTLTANEHKFKDGWPVTFTATPPSPLKAGTTYYVVNADTDTFQVALSRGEPAIKLTSDPSGSTVESPPTVSGVYFNIVEDHGHGNLVLDSCYISGPGDGGIAYIVKKPITGKGSWEGGVNTLVTRNCELYNGARFDVAAAGIGAPTWLDFGTRISDVLKGPLEWDVPHSLAGIQLIGPYAGRINNQIIGFDPRPGASLAQVGAIRRQTVKVTLTAATFVKAGLEYPRHDSPALKYVDVLTFPAKTRLVGLMAEITTAFAGRGITNVKMKVGPSVKPDDNDKPDDNEAKPDDNEAKPDDNDEPKFDEFLVEFNAGVTGVRGTSDAHLGSKLRRADAIQTGYIFIGRKAIANYASLSQHRKAM